MSTAAIACAVVDDEPMALELLARYVTQVADLRLLGAYRGAVKASHGLAANPVDLLFLDIDMPDVSGLQLLDTLVQCPLVIFTTAYSQYAVASYDYDAVDYLLKPIEFPRFLKAVQKVRQLRSLLGTGAHAAGAVEQDTLFIKSGGEVYPVKIPDLLYVEGAGNYVEFVTTTRKILALMSLQEVQALLAPYGFWRIHRSFVVAGRHVDIIEPEHVRICHKRIPIGEKYRGSVKNLLAQGRLLP